MDADNNGDGKLTLLSQYAMNSMVFSTETTGVTNDYTTSSVGAWLNDREDGFLKDTFTSAEDSAIPLTNVITANYKTDGTNEELAQDMGLDWPRSVQQKVYLPWGTYNGSRNDLLPNVPEDPTTVYWSANPVIGKNQIADVTRRQSVRLKAGMGAGTKVFYWLRSPMSGNPNAATAVSVGDNSWVFSQNSNNNAYATIGVRPVTKLDPNAIVFASEIKTNPENETQTQAVVPNLLEGEIASPNYKLTILGNDGEKNPYTMSLTGQTDGSVIPVTKGTPLTLTTNDPSHSGEGYTINYKVVMEADGSRFLMDYGVVDTVNPAGTETQIAIPTADWLRSTAETDTLDLYVWLQKNNTDTSNEASQPVHLTISLTGGEATALPTPEPQPLDDAATEAAQVAVSYPGRQDESPDFEL